MNLNYKCFLTRAIRILHSVASMRNPRCRAVAKAAGVTSWIAPRKSLFRGRRIGLSRKWLTTIFRTISQREATDLEYRRRAWSTMILICPLFWQRGSQIPTGQGRRTITQRKAVEFQRTSMRSYRRKTKSKNNLFNSCRPAFNKWRKLKCQRYWDGVKESRWKFCQRSVKAFLMLESIESKTTQT